MTILEGEALLRHGQEIARRYAHRVGSEEARDLGAEAVLHAVRRPSPDGRMEPWLERIARNLFIDGLRRSSPTLVEMDEAQPASTERPGETPEDSTMLAERRRQVRQSLASLPPDLRRALITRFWGEMSDADAANRLGVAPATVRTRIHRSLRRLRQSLTGLRALLPPFLGKVGGAALAPALVAALVVLPAAPTLPDPETSVAAAAPVQSPVPSRTKVEHLPPKPTPTIPPLRLRPRPSPKPAPVPTVAAKPEAVAIEDAVQGAPRPEVVVLSPDTWLIVAVPASESPSLIDVPVNFVTAFDKMVEDEL